MSKITKHTENVTKKQSLASEIIADQAAKTNIEEAPDLILVCNEFGEEGYIRSTDCDAGASTLEEAANWEPREYSVNMYLQDGLTIIGQFKIG